MQEGCHAPALQARPPASARGLCARCRSDPRSGRTGICRIGRQRGFESGTLTGWTVVNEPGGNGNWLTYSGTRALISRRRIATPPDGRFAAVSDQNGPGAHVLFQDVVLPAGYQHTLKFVWFYTNSAGFRAPASLSYNLYPNRQYRVDVVSPTAGVFSVAPGDVLAQVVGTQPGDPVTRAPTPVTVDHTALAGGSVRLRFAEVDNQGNLAAGVDLVQVFTSPTTKAQCSGDGWRMLTDPSGAAFKNKGDCTNWVATHGRNPPGNGHPVSKPVGPPVSPPVGPPVFRPVGPPISTPVGPPTR